MSTRVNGVEEDLRRRARDTVGRYLPGLDKLYHLWQRGRRMDHGGKHSWLFEELDSRMAAVR